MELLTRINSEITETKKEDLDKYMIAISNISVFINIFFQKDIRVIKLSNAETNYYSKFPTYTKLNNIPYEYFYHICELYQQINEKQKEVTDISSARNKYESAQYKK